MNPAGIEKLSLEVKRVIKAPRDRVYAAWTDPAQLRTWFGPEGVQTRDLAADVRVGGKYRWDVINPEGEVNTGNWNPGEKSCSHGTGTMMRLGRTISVSLRSNLRTPKVALSCG